MIACDVVIVGGGAAGLMCAIEAGKRGGRVLVIERGAGVDIPYKLLAGQGNWYGLMRFRACNADPALKIIAGDH